MLKLRVSVGSSYDPSTYTIISPNNDADPLFLDTPNFTGRICVRIRDFLGITPPNTTKISTSPYFEGNKDKYSIQVQGKFKGKWTANDIFFGNDFDRKIKLPRISWLGLKILKWIDPCLETDPYCDKPWAYSPLFFTVNTLCVEHRDQEDELPPWPSSDGRHIGESAIYDPDLKLPLFSDTSSRKKYFTTEDNRKRFGITEEQIWNFDFSNPYVDFNNISVKLPGLQLGILQYWDGQPFRYVCKSRDSTIVFFIVIFELVETNEESSGNEMNEQPLPRKNRAEHNQSDDVLTPKSDARWASVKSPSYILPSRQIKYFEMRTDYHVLGALKISKVT
ncbi:1964_t:CDS:2 [Acaulospora morrowiae]|uniref:1964_t:CDS:1 n=1 Tax=Acaulospora morrowiae TaxID=94023 RepID=A0A9N9FM78_9GLOM|nr:1964_t:CDS:2 [Acaulospora morrowiae]